jgi:glyoxylase-like metal-dependent hydrolase (beta-lactamase superfamily II)
MRITPWLYLVGSRQFGLSSRYDCHVYALRSHAGILLIDAGSGLAHDDILANLHAEFGPSLGPGTILLTHRHPDHICGAPRLSAALGWPVVASFLTAPILIAGDEAGCGLTAAQQKGAYPPSLRLDPCPVAQSFDDGQTLQLEGFSLSAIRVRGHSADSFAFLFEHAGRRCLIAGDIVFYGGILGLINTPDSSLQSYLEDFPKLANLSLDVLLPGHGLFTLAGAQRHIDTAQAELDKGFVPRSIGQGDLIF